MKTGICVGMALILAAAGCARHEREPVKDTVSQNAEDQQALQTLRDLGLSPQDMLQLVRQELSRRAGGERAVPADEPATVVSSSPDQSAAASMAPQTDAAVTEPPPAPATPEPAATVVTTVVNVIREAAPVPPATVVVVDVPEVQVVNRFYDELTPYGRWISVDLYGRAWQPTVVAFDAGWRPYCSAGRWVWTAMGWQWESSYSWGSIVFHYGRWHCTERHGWVWIPGAAWAPAWVSWRQAGSCVGWAPLPPGADHSSFRDDEGFDARFGLRASHYTFVPCESFLAADVRPLALNSVRGAEVYRSSSFVRGDRAPHGKRPVSVGPSRETIEKAIGHRIDASGIAGEHRSPPAASRREADDGHSARDERAAKAPVAPDWLGRGSRIAPGPAISVKPRATAPDRFFTPPKITPRAGGPVSDADGTRRGPGGPAAGWAAPTNAARHDLPLRDSAPVAPDRLFTPPKITPRAGGPVSDAGGTRRGPGGPAAGWAAPTNAARHDLPLRDSAPVLPPAASRRAEEGRSDTRKVKHVTEAAAGQPAGNQAAAAAKSPGGPAPSTAPDSTVKTAPERMERAPSAIRIRPAREVPSPVTPPPSPPEVRREKPSQRNSAERAAPAIVPPPVPAATAAPQATPGVKAGGSADRD